MQKFKDGEDAMTLKDLRALLVKELYDAIFVAASTRQLDDNVPPLWILCIDDFPLFIAIIYTGY